MSVFDNAVIRKIVTRNTYGFNTQQITRSGISVHLRTGTRRQCLNYVNCILIETQIKEMYLACFKICP